MEEKCEECSILEHNIYWIHFQCIHFCQILDSDFRSQLMIPKKFSDYTREKLQDKVILKGPGGTTTWEVRLRKSEDMLFLGDGWTEFVNAFCLQENDILIFKYNGNSSFSVLIFDRGSLCEKESSYFIKKCGHSRSGTRNQEKKFLPEIVEELTEEHLHEEFESTPLKKPQKDTDGHNKISPGGQIASDVPDTSYLETACADSDTAIERPRNQQEPWSWEPVKLPPKLTVKKQKPSTKVTYVSQRRPVTEEEKKSALRRAHKELDADGFIVVMRPTHVYRIFFMKLPTAWVHGHLTYKNQFVHLRTKENTWPTKLLCLADGRAALSLGWRAFALGNCLEESDVCVFKLRSQKHEPVVLDVSIFRVVPDMVKSVRVPQASQKKFSENQEKRFIKEEFTEEHLHEEFVSVPSKKPRKDSDEQYTCSPEQNIASDALEISHLKTPLVEIDTASERPSDQQESWSWEPVKLSTVSEKLKPSKKPTYVSRRRPVTQAEKEVALHMARKELTEYSFLVVMGLSHVYRSFFMNIPAAWMNKHHITYKKQTVRLRTEDDTWPTRLICLSGGRAGLSHGWRAFALDNCLEESDVCVFKLASQKHEPVVFDVSIFRVVPDAVKSVRVPGGCMKNFSEVGLP